MSISEIASALWRRRVLFAITFVASLAVVVAITAAVPKAYRATATIYVGTDVSRLDTSEGEQLTRTYTALASNPNTAQAAIDQLGLDITRSDLLSKMSFAPVQRTQLLEISAEDESAAEAERITNGYADVFTDQVAAAVATGRAPSPVSVSQPAIEPNDPVRPNPPLYIGFGTILALLVAAGAALLRDRFDRGLRIGSRDQEVMGERILARIPTLPGPSVTSSNGPASESVRTAQILRSDAFRVLRTNLDLAPSAPARTIVVTSPSAGEGKTTISSQLALTVATDGDRAAIVDCDLRRGALETRGFGKRPRRTGGLAEYLAGDATLRQVVTPSEVPGLKIVWAGHHVAEPGPLLRSDNLSTLVESLREGNDWVIIDSPPLAVGDDALVISSHADGTVVVVDAGQTSASALEAGLARLRNIRARVLGIVVNGATPTELDAYRYLVEPLEEKESAQRLQSK
jgi:succinoglycan biosynthesis transport protein ExoP